MLGDLGKFLSLSLAPHFPHLFIYFLKAWRRDLSYKFQDLKNLIGLLIISHTLNNLGFSFFFFLPEFLLINGIAITLARVKAHLLHVYRDSS